MIRLFLYSVLRQMIANRDFAPKILLISFIKFREFEKLGASFRMTDVVNEENSVTHWITNRSSLWGTESTHSSSSRDMTMDVFPEPSSPTRAIRTSADGSIHATILQAITKLGDTYTIWNEGGMLEIEEKQRRCKARDGVKRDWRKRIAQHNDNEEERYEKNNEINDYSKRK